jgi:SWI/SNF-related matrix-associated actin-dependent regulator of chromatin subfamily A3
MLSYAHTITRLVAHHLWIVNVKAQLRSSNDGAPRPDQLYLNGHYILFDVSLVGDYFELRYLGQKFARLNKNFCSEVRRLALFGVKFQAYLSKSDWESLCTIQSDYRTATAVAFNVEVNVYGFEHHADQIGDILSQVGVFLQDPIYGLDDMPYHNPQVLELRGMKERQEALGTVEEESASNPISFGSATEQAKTSPERQRNTTDLVDSILDSLSQNGILQEISTDRNRIKAELLPCANGIHGCRSCTLIAISDTK